MPYASRDYNPGSTRISTRSAWCFSASRPRSAPPISSSPRFAPAHRACRSIACRSWCGERLTASVANLIVVPAVSLAFFLLWMDRQFGTHFFDPAGGGQPLLWQHLFWIFGHPWVYAIVLPAMGMVSDGLPVFCRRPLVGLFVGGAVDRGHHDLGLRRLGAPHVRDRSAGPRPGFFFRRLDRHHDSLGGRGVRLARDDLARAARSSPRRSCSSPP